MSASLTPLPGGNLVRLLLLGGGLTVLFCALVVLQLSLYRAGDLAKPVDKAGSPPPDVRPAPRGLRNPKLRTVWENMEETRNLLREKGMEAERTRRIREKEILRLPDEEEVLFVGERGWLTLWPLTALSLVLLLSSSSITTVGSQVSSFFLLVTGLFALLLTMEIKRRTRYYLTNFRILVRKKLLCSQRIRWSAVHYGRIKACSLRETLMGDRLILVADDNTIDIKGLARDPLDEAHGILRSKLPDEVFP